MLDGREVRVGEAIKSRFCRARLPMRTIRGQGAGEALRAFARCPPPGRQHLMPWPNPAQSRGRSPAVGTLSPGPTRSRCFLFPRALR